MPEKGGLKARALEELRLFWVIALYLFLFFGSFALYRRLVEAEGGVAYLHYGFALVQALVIAKVILIGRLFGFSKRFEDRPLIVPVLYKSVVFAMLVFAFGVAEHFVEGWLRDHRAGGALHDFASLGVRELAARAVILVVTFVPFFAFGEIGRVLGPARLGAMFFGPRGASDAREGGGA